MKVEELEKFGVNSKCLGKIGLTNRLIERANELIKIFKLKT